MSKPPLGPDEHWAIPTKGNDEVHQGLYRTHCERCTATAAQLTRKHAPRFNGQVIQLGDAVKLKDEHRFTGMPEWGTITAIRFNSHNGEVWMHSFAFGESLIITEDTIAEVKPWQ